MPVLALAIFTAATRLRDLGVHWIHADEGIYFEAAYASSGDFARLVALNAHPPGYYLLLRVLAWLQLDWTAMRAVSTVASAATVFVGFLVGRRLFGAFAGIAVAVLLFLAPSATVLSQVMRPYALQLLLLSVASWFLLRAWASQRCRDWWAYGVAALAALSLQYGTVVFLAAAAVASLAVRNVPRRTLLAIAAVHAAIGAAVAALWFLHVSPRLMGSAVQQSAQDGWLGEHFVGSAVEALANLVAVHRYLFGAEFGGVAAVGFGLGLAVLFGARPRFAVLTAAAIAVAVALSGLRLYPFGPSRHSAYLAAVAAPVIGGGVAWLATRGVRGAAVAAVVVALALWQRDAIDGALGGPPGTANPRVAEGNLRTAGVEDLGAKLEQLASGTADCTLVVDSYTYFSLAPFFAREHVPVPGLAGEAFRASRWGRCTILRHPAWMMTSGPEKPRASDHLAALLRELHAATELTGRLHVAEVGLFPRAGNRLSSGVLSVPRQTTRDTKPLVALRHLGDDVTLFELNVADYLAALDALPARRGR